MVRSEAFTIEVAGEAVGIVVAITWLAYTTIEMPGRALGRRLLASPILRTVLRPAR